MGYDFTDRFGMEVGAQRYYDPNGDGRLFRLLHLTINSINSI